ncbi:hypothetical protein NC651_036678 [Populus alba x Populus x berolinensis]|nr:hypothetical protein NC651_036678 [Populus alba x Populus x berolinensis]
MSLCINIDLVHGFKKKYKSFIFLCYFMSLFLFVYVISTLFW